MPVIPPTTELLLSWDRQRARSQQAELGMSSLGGCRRAAGYTLAGTPREDTQGSIQAVLGTAIHEIAAQAARLKIGQHPGLQAENLEVHFAGLTGHPDVYAEPMLRDIKTTGRTSTLEAWKAQGPPRRHQWQVMTYAAALILTGRRVSEVELDYIARDSGATWLWSSPFQISLVREAMAWLQAVRETPLEYLARDYRPGSPQCGSCPFFSRCWQEQAVPERDLRSALFVDEPDAALWAKRLEDARERKRQAEADEADARGALDAIRPNTHGTADVAVPGLGRVLRFSVQKGRTRLDAEAVKADYARVGAEPPTITGDPIIKVTLAAPPEEKS